MQLHEKLQKVGVQITTDDLHMFKGLKKRRRQQVRVRGVPSGVLQWMCIFSFWLGKGVPALSFEKL